LIWGELRGHSIIFLSTKKVFLIQIVSIYPEAPDAIFAPDGQTVNRLFAFGSQAVKQLVVISPPIMGPAYFREAAEVIGAAAGGPPDREKMAGVLKRHGMTVVAHPPVK
jgi:hypothetical protein